MATEKAVVAVAVEIAEVVVVVVVTSFPHLTDNYLICH